MKLSDAARELRNKRAREYYATHRRQQAEANRRYWEKQAFLLAQREAEAQTIAPSPDPGTVSTDREDGEAVTENN